MKFDTIRKRLLTLCLFASISIHIGAIWFLYLNPLNIAETQTAMLMKPSPSPQMMPRDDEELLVAKIEKALEESLNEVIIGMAHTPRNSQDIASEDELDDSEGHIINLESTKQVFTPSPKVHKDEWEMMEFKETTFATSMPPLFDLEMESALNDFALDHECQDELFPYESEKYSSIDFSDHRLSNVTSSAQIIQDDFTLTDDQFSPSALPMNQAENLSPHLVQSLKKLKTPSRDKNGEMNEEKMFTKLEESTSPKLILPNSVDYLRDKWVKRSLAERTLPNFDHYGIDEIASNLEWENDLDVNITFMPDANSNRYIFSISINPGFESECESMRQNFYFLLDRSSSIEKNKFNRYKRALHRSLAALREGDNFNIYIFDKNVTMLSDQTLPVTPKTIQMATDFLEGQRTKSRPAEANPYSSIENMLPKNLNPDEMHSAILLTDGNGIMSKHKQKQTLTKWAQRYGGLVNFYAASAGKGNQLVLLDLLSYATGGTLLYSDTNAAFPRKLVRLIKDLHDPILKNITVEINAKDTSAIVSLHPQTQYLPPMFGSKPYVIVGTMDEISDITLFVQGRNNDKWLNIRKEISFKDAEKGGRSLEKLWAHVQSNICYEHFLKNGKSTHLKEAKDIVAPYRGDIAMDQ